MEDNQQKNTAVQTSQSTQQSFKERPLQERQERFAKLKEQNPTKIPLVFEKHPKSKLQGASSLKFMSTRTLKLSYFANQIRTTLNLPAECSLFFSTSSRKLVKQDTLMGDLYDGAKDADGFLYIQYREVESFGGLQH